MQILFIFSLIFAILVSVFAVMNSEPVTIKLLWKQFEFSQAIVILGSAAFGAIIVAFLGIVNRVKASLKIRELQNKVKILEKEIEEIKPVDPLNTEEDKISNIDDNSIESINNDVAIEEIKIEDDKRVNGD
ncbi:MAG: LapA family protein [Clostridia bacterium]|nr:LapA family protein [Clostridia bacterium]